MSRERLFLDTNVLIHAFAEDRRTAAAEGLLTAGGEISVQVLNEFTSVARRKLGFSWAQLEEALEAIQSLVRKVHPLDQETHRAGLQLARRYNLSIYDGLIVASALQAACTILYSEDLHNGLIVGEQLRIINPFDPGR